MTLNGEVLKNGMYLLTRRIGRGSYGVVFQGIHQPSKKLVAIKIIGKESIDTEKKRIYLMREIESMHLFNHPLICSFYDFFETDSKYCIVMELLEGKEVNQIIQDNQRLEFKDAKKYFIQLIFVLNYLQNEKKLFTGTLKLKIS